MIAGDDLPPAVSLILCEGPEDRAFWGGLLHARGWAQVKPKSGRGGEARRPRGRKGRGGGGAAGGDRRPHTFGTPEPSDKDPDPAPRPYVEVHPTGGGGNLLPTLRSLLEEDRADPVITRTLLNFDTDLSAEDERDGRTGLTVDGVRSSLDGGGWPSHAAEGEPGSLRLDGGPVVTLTPWRTADPVGDGVPEKQTLERVVCTAVVARPDRGPAVAGWLKSRPGLVPGVEPHRHKSTALSYYAGWYPGGGSFAFFAGLWRDPPVAAELERLLRDAGTLAAVDRLLAPPASSP